MGQVTIYLDRETEALVATAAKTAGVSKSKWIAEAIKEKARTEWPAQVLASFGTWEDFPSLEEIRATYGEDLPREKL